ncbi:DUF1129 family protein [Sporosarcina gallistercoris]|uniref:DUF1129 family protein n=1 Tax=Sporosarcina gallistercoris TaxID=2762245 RepID=A0ABR8PHN6_9BACL|nr:DUF1129 family protein [Sporosarcina gallistercoris]MBD7907692.1 DUF1129 family protein [Sporosarcina gallistercoris]
MVTTKELIQENNEKREQLTEENERYYSNMLVYIRSKFLLSERATEELLMEMLEHLLEGQQDGKSAEEIYGRDPKAYADELIAQMPKEKKKNQLLFGIQLTVGVLGWMVIARGAILGIMSFFQPVDERLYVVSTIALLAAVLLITAVGVLLLINMVNKTAFEEKKSTWKFAIGGGMTGVMVFGLLMGIAFFFKERGPAIEFPWLASLLAGFVLLLVSQWISRTNEGIS